MKTCSKCGGVKPLDMFYCMNKRAIPKKYHPDCKLCYLKRRAEYVSRNREVVNAKVKDYRTRNRDRVNAKARAYGANNRDKIRNSKLKQTYGITLVEWEKMFDAQGRKCAICCSLTTKGVGWHTDHCHATGRVRGILCDACNKALGGYEAVLRQNLARVEAYLAA